MIWLFGYLGVGFVLTLIQLKLEPFINVEPFDAFCVSAGTIFLWPIASSWFFGRKLFRCLGFIE